MTIFLADDSAIIRRCLKGFLLEIPGIEIVGDAAQSSLTYDVVDSEKPHIVILEVHHNRGKGLDLLRKLKSGSSSPIVIVFAAHRYPQLHDACINAGADFFFQKSRDFAVLTNVLRNLSRQGGTLHGDLVSGTDRTVAHTGSSHVRSSFPALSALSISKEISR